MEERTLDFEFNLRIIRETLGWTQARLAERSGLTRAAVSQLEGGQRRPQLNTVARLCNALGVTADRLIFHWTT